MERKRRDKDKTIHPRCGRRYPSDTHVWTPALIKKHEIGCPQCQALKERGAVDARRSRRVRERLEEFYSGNAPPFETDD